MWSPDHQWGKEDRGHQQLHHIWIGQQGADANATRLRGKGRGSQVGSSATAEESCAGYGFTLLPLQKEEERDDELSWDSMACTRRIPPCCLSPPPP